MPLFVAGFIETLHTDIKSGRMRNLGYKLCYLKNLMYTATLKEWGTILDLHTVVLLDIERGNREWSDY